MATQVLDLFPSRDPIGYVMIGRQRLPVMQSDSFTRSKNRLFERVGSYSGLEPLPVGTILHLVVPDNPATLVGYGTWAQIAEGRVLVGVSSTDPDFNTIRETGGAKTAAISAHAGTAVADHASHTHDFTQSSNAATPDLLAEDLTGTGVAASGTTGGPSATLSHTVTQPNNHSDVSVVQPYYVVYLWERTA